MVIPCLLRIPQYCYVAGSRINLQQADLLLVKHPHKCAPAAHISGYLNNQWWLNHALTSSIYCLCLVDLTVASEYIYMYIEKKIVLYVLTSKVAHCMMKVRTCLRAVWMENSHVSSIMRLVGFVYNKPDDNMGLARTSLLMRWFEEYKERSPPLSHTVLMSRPIAAWNEPRCDRCLRKCCRAFWDN